MPQPAAIPPGNAAGDAAGDSLPDRRLDAGSGPGSNREFDADMRVTVTAGDSLTLIVQIEHPRLLPNFVAERLRRGIPVTVGYQMELWRDRSVWFDANVANRVTQYKVTRDAWTGAYSLTSADTTVVVDSLSQVIGHLTDIRLPFPLHPDIWKDSDARHRLAVTAVVIPLSAQDLGEVEDWLTGELGGGGGGLLAIPRGLFNIVRDLSGLGDHKAKAQSDRFYLRKRGRAIAVVPESGATYGR